MPPSVPLDYVYATASDLEALMSVEGKENKVDDNGDGVINATEDGYIQRAITWASDRINFFVLQRYDAHCLQTSWIVNQWCTILAAWWLSVHRGNPPPGSFEELKKQTEADLLLVHNRTFDIPNIGERFSSLPSWSNVRVDMLYALRKIRVERPLSDRTKVPFKQNIDWPSQMIVEP
jgi:hypothetical protein